MSYITSSLSPYRSDNLWKEFAGILKEDYEWVCSSLKDRGLIFPIAFVILMSLSKGRFLHPEQDRVITPREAALLQSFPEDYQFPLDIPKQALALLIGNALPPKFSYYQSKNIKKHLDNHLLRK